MSAYDLKPKWLPDEKVVATKLRYEHKDTGEVLVSFASVSGLPNAKASVFMQKHHLEEKAVAPKTPKGGGQEAQREGSQQASSGELAQ